MAQTQKQWAVAGKTGFDSLKLNESAPVPKLGDKDVLVKCKAFISKCSEWAIADQAMYSPWHFP